jgi:hypothetical protein
MSELDKRTTYPQSGRGFTAHQLSYNALPSHLQEVSEPFGESAQQIEKTLPSNPEKTTALRKLLEAKDCAVRALLFKTEDQPQKEAA